jgi:hypothetical protein
MEANGGPIAGRDKATGWGESATDVTVTPG